MTAFHYLFTNCKKTCDAKLYSGQTANQFHPQVLGSRAAGSTSDSRKEVECDRGPVVADQAEKSSNKGQCLEYTQ